jgi:hypothetical protein
MRSEIYWSSEMVFLKPALPGCGAGGEEAIVRRMSAVHVGMHYATEDREIVAMLLEQFQVGRELIPASAVLREEMFRQQSKIIADAEEAARLPARRHVGGHPFRDRGERRSHRVEHGQRKQDARAAQKFAPRKGAPS